MNNRIRGIDLKEGLLKDFYLHALWLRERVTDEINLDTNNLQRLYDPSLIDTDIFILEYKINNQLLYVKFSDKTESNYNIYDLHKEIIGKDFIPKKIFWSASIDLKMLQFNSSFLKKDEKLLINLLEKFYEYGFVIINNIEAKEKEIIKFAERIGPIMETNYGRIFDVISKKKANNLAYTSLGLSVHTDNPYRKPVPGIQILHCIVNEATGGDTTLVDGYSVCEYLRKNNKSYFDTLTSTEVLFRFIDKDIILENKGKLIELDSNGNFKQIRLNGRSDYVPLLDKDRLTKYYKARKFLFKLCNSLDFQIKFRLKKSTLIMFDNHRLLHGRTKFFPNTGLRHLQGCYLGHDAAEGKLRLLKSLSN